MTVVRLINFGGILPAVSERALPPQAATVASNLVASLPEFRPTLAAVEIVGVFAVNNPRTIYRMQRTDTGGLNTDLSTGWHSYEDITYHARWPSNDNNTERTTVSSADGSYAPRVIDATGEDRLLGVPIPDKPAVTLNEGVYYTPKDRENDIARIYIRVLRAIHESLDRMKIGAAYTDNEVEGYLENDPEIDTALPLGGPSPQRNRVYRYDDEDGTITDAYTDAVTGDVAWVQATKKGVFRQATVSDPLWMGGIGTWHYVLPYHAYGIGYKAVEADIRTAVDAVENIETDQATEIAEKVAEMFDRHNEDAVAVIKPLKEAVDKLEYVLDHRPPGTKPAAEVDTAIEALLEATAKEIWLFIFKNSGAPGEITGVTTGA